MKSIQALTRNAQQALGVEAPTHMKGLQVFIADIRNCPTKEQEEKRVQKELAKIRQRFTAEGDKMTGYDKKKYIWKLLYAYMLGYEIDFGHLQAVKLCSSAKFSEKTAGYLAISLLLAENEKMLTMVVNSIKQDMHSGNDSYAALALNTVANIGGSEFADNLFADISKGLLADRTRLTPYIKRKSCICLLRLYRKDTDAMSPDVWRSKLATFFAQTDVGLVTSASGLVLAILEQGTFPASDWVEIVPAVAQALIQLVQGECPEHYVYYHVPCPWLQTKLFRILQFFPVDVFDVETLNRIRQILSIILGKPIAGRPPAAQGANAKKRGKADAERQNRSNAEHAVLFEAMNLMIHLEDKCDPQSTSSAAGLLGNFIQSIDPNIRYLGLETMARLATNPGTHEHLERYRITILEKMHESDISIRRQALNLLYALCRPENWQSIVDELLQILGVSDPLLKEELVLKIAILAERNAPNFKVYVDVVFKMLESAPESVGDDVWFRVVQVVTGFEDSQEEAGRESLKKHAAEKAFQNLSVPGNQMLHDTLVKLGVYLIGEFGHFLPKQITPKAKVDVLKQHFARSAPQTRAIIELAMLKLFNSSPQVLHREVMPFIEELQESKDVELQQRSCEMLRLVTSEDLLDHVLSPMPHYTETVQQNNPLVRRLKFQNKSRAHTRAQLEEAAKSEGGVYKFGKNVAGQSTAGGSNNAVSAANNKDDSDSGSESGSESSGEEAPPAAPDAVAGDPTMELWKQLCILPQGRFFSSNSLVLEFKQEYNAALGNLSILFVNSSKNPIPNIRVSTRDEPFMRFRSMNDAPTSLAPGAQAPHYVQCQCMRPFQQPAKYYVEYMDGNQPRQVPLMLPVVMTKFVTPAQMEVAQFKQYFESFSGPPKENQMVGQAKVPPNDWPNYLTKGLNLFMLRESTPPCTFAAGTFNTGTPDPSTGKPMTVPIMVRLEFDASSRKVRITVRTSVPEATAGLSKLFENFFLVP